ncbi:BREX protein BrxB domain-containing protein [Salinibius halmophilus]|uniref:BREX protein BrxB domain-containing protein n=1 Tax=Salinibius halmophilus TaxID=1853216 RepID=UPI000E665457|nr:BREX protein BrxB domain-containing protein [Salinibius halmophilus]
MADRISNLLKEYESHISLSWPAVASGEERSIFAIYKPEDELKLRARLEAFEQATTAHGHQWQLLNITHAFEAWLAGQEYAEAYFENPEYLEANYEFFAEDLVSQLRQNIQAQSETANTVVALLGCGTLFGISSVSDLVRQLADTIEGRLLVFFPGEKDGNTYRLLDAKNGWGYLATALKG